MGKIVNEIRTLGQPTSHKKVHSRKLFCRKLQTKFHTRYTIVSTLLSIKEVWYVEQLIVFVFVFKFYFVFLFVFVFVFVFVFLFLFLFLFPFLLPAPAPVPAILIYNNRTLHPTNKPRLP